MTNLQPELVRIVEQACSLTERLVTGEISSNPSDADTRVNARLEKWCQTAAQGDLEKFQKRLAWDNINLSTINRLLGHVSLSGTQNLPNWVETFQAGIEAAASIPIETLEPGKTYSFLAPDNPIPFEEIFLPFIQVARDKLTALTGDNYPSLNATELKLVILRISGAATIRSISITGTITK